MAFKDILGQDQVITWFKRAMTQDRLASSYLFVGSEGIGKRLFALNLAKVLNCLTLRDGDACETCASCKKINAGTHPDVLLIAPQGQTIKIEQIRRIQHTLSFKPAFARRRMVIIDNAETMTPDAANAFLKTLEEPPLNTTLILIAQDKTQLLSTIVSRCQIVRFRPLPLKIVQEVLKKKGLEKDEATKIASLAEGSLGKAMQLLEKQEGLKTALLGIKSGVSVRELLASIEKLVEKCQDQRQLFSFFDVYQGILRDILFLKKGIDDILINKDLTRELKTLAEGLSIEKIQKKLELLQEAKKLIRQNVQKRLVLEHLVLNGD
jgi:DNA polymerase-3 subunit delta'